MNAQPDVFSLRRRGRQGYNYSVSKKTTGGMDNQAVRSCTLTIGRAEGHSVTTIEGLGTPEKPNRVQAAFIAEQAAQCGYCTNGMIMAAKALLARTPKPTVDQIKHALDGNLCRCGTHTRIVRAIQRASQV